MKKEERNRKIDSAKKRDSDINYCEIMHKAEFYNYDRIPGYNHHTGWIDQRYPRKRDEQVMEPIYVKLNIVE